MKTIYILLITVLSWSLQACQCGKTGCLRTVFPRIYPDYAELTFPLNIAPPTSGSGRTRITFQTEIANRGRRADILSYKQES